MDLNSLSSESQALGHVHEGGLCVNCGDADGTTRPCTGRVEAVEPTHGPFSRALAAGRIHNRLVWVELRREWLPEWYARERASAERSVALGQGCPHPDARYTQSFRTPTCLTCGAYC